MKILIVEDDYASRRFLNKLLSDYGDCDITVNGREAVDAFMLSCIDEAPYHLVCLDVMMPELDGIKALKAIRGIEHQFGISEKDRTKIIMISALNNVETIENSFSSGCEAYAAKPLDTQKFIDVLKRLGLII